MKAWRVNVQQPHEITWLSSVRTSVTFFFEDKAVAYAATKNALPMVKAEVVPTENMHPFLLHYYENAFDDLNTDGAVVVGNYITDPYKNSTRTAYTTPELLEEAKQYLEQHNRNQRKTGDDYYAQPWV